MSFVLQFSSRLVQYPGWDHNRRRTGKSAINNFLTITLIVLALVGCATSPTGRSQFMLISPDAAIVESRKAYASTVSQLDAEDKLLDDPLLADRVALVTGRLVSEAIEKYPHTANWRWSVALIDGPETVNAWCMAGGSMAIYSGLFEKLKLTDDEFAQIMGHEISHALANHTAERMSIAIAATGLSMAAASMVSEHRNAALEGAALAAKLAIEMPNSRAAESEADQMGIELAARAGYRPRAAVSLWNKMEKAGGSGPPEFLNTHPSPGNRRARLQQMVPAMEAIRRPHLAPVHPVRIIR